MAKKARRGSSDTRRKTGRGVEHVPTSESRQRVLSLIGVSGAGIEATAKILGISTPTLHKYYADEIQTARTRAVEKVADSLHKVAHDPTHPRHVDAAKFFLQTQGRWSTQVNVQVEGTVRHEHYLADLSTLSDENLLALTRVAEELEGKSNHARVVDAEVLPKLNGHEGNGAYGSLNGAHLNGHVHDGPPEAEE